MNYAVHYDRLMARARGRALGGYIERHHVLPRCMGGSDDPANIVVLTPEEHYVAHQLLVKMHQGNRRLSHAAVWMARRCVGHKSYGWLRRRHATDSSALQKGVARRPLSAEHRAKLSASQRGRQKTLDAIAKTAAARRGMKHTAEAREKCGAFNRGRKLSAEHKAKALAALARGRGAPRKPLSEQQRAHLSAFWLGRTFSPETKAKISAAKLSYWEARRAAADAAL